MKHFSGRVALVTGGASGIGYGMVHNFLQLGMKAVVVDWNEDTSRTPERSSRAEERFTSCERTSAIASR